MTNCGVAGLVSEGGCALTGVVGTELPARRRGAVASASADALTFVGWSKPIA
jgi:hypothetical protein